MKAIELLDECTDRWSSDSGASIYDIANEVGLEPDDEYIVEMISVI